MLSWSVLFGQALWCFPRWFALIPFNSVDIIALSNKWILVAAILVASMPFVTVYLSKNTASIQLFLVGALFLMMFVSNAMRIDDATKSGRHAQEMAGPISSLFEKSGKRVNVYLDYQPLAVRIAEYGLEFFGVPKKKFVVRLVTSDDGINQHDTSDPTLLVTHSAYQAIPVHEYALGDKLFRIYNYVDPKIFVPEIIDYGPKRVIAESSFNTQPSGNSAMWFKLKNLSSNTQITFDNHRLDLTLGEDGLVSAVIPAKLIKEPHAAQLRVYGINPDLEGNSVSLIIEPPN